MLPVAPGARSPRVVAGIGFSVDVVVEEELVSVLGPDVVEVLVVVVSLTSEDGLDRSTGLSAVWLLAAQPAATRPTAAITSANLLFMALLLRILEEMMIVRL